MTKGQLKQLIKECIKEVKNKSESGIEKSKLAKFLKGRTDDNDAVDAMYKALRFHLDNEPSYPEEIYKALRGELQKYIKVKGEANENKRIPRYGDR
jgi:hypothetical protein